MPDLSAQYWYDTYDSGDPPSEELFNEPKNKDSMVVKPAGGFWTSPEPDDDRPPGWERWCSTAIFGEPEVDRYVLSVDDAKLYEIDSYSNLVSLLETYRRDDLEPWIVGRDAALDFEAIAEDWNGIYLTENGQNQTRLNEPSLYGWDCECVLWLDWVFTEVQHDERITVWTKDDI